MRFIYMLAFVCLMSVGALAAPLTFSSDLKPADLRLLGNENAPATIYVFTSFSCPHCSAYHEKVLPSIKSDFVETGMAKLIYVDMPYDARAMMGTMISRCLPVSHFDAFTKVMFENQKNWGSSQNPKQVISGYARLLDMSEQSINSCFADKDLQKSIVGQRDNLANLYGVKGMPTTVVVQGGKNKSFSGSDKDVIINGIKQTLAQ